MPARKGYIGVKENMIAFLEQQGGKLVAVSLIVENFPDSHPQHVKRVAAELFAAGKIDRPFRGVYQAMPKKKKRKVIIVRRKKSSGK